MNMEKIVRGWIAENDAISLAMEVLFKLHEKGNCTPEQIEKLIPGNYGGGKIVGGPELPQQTAETPPPKVGERLVSRNPWQ